MSIEFSCSKILNFHFLNKYWISKFVNKRKYIISSNALSRMQAFIKRYDSEFNLLPMPFVVEKQSYDELVKATKMLMKVQLKILTYLASSITLKDMLAYFDLPIEILPFINWDELMKGDNMIARFDIVPSKLGFQLCEINAESSIGGLKLRDCYREYLHALNFHDNFDSSPREQIAEFLYKKTLSNDYEQIVIFTMKKYLNEGTGTVHALYECIAHRISHLPVILAHELSYPEELLEPSKGKKTLVYRLAMYDDVNCFDLFSKLFSSGAMIINSFSSEIRSNKKWFAMFHDEQFQHLLSKEERLFIEKYIPLTYYLTKENFELFLEKKEEFVFKKNRTYGGTSVLVGCEYERDVIANRLTDLKHWTAQKLIECPNLNLPLDDSFQKKACKVVLGLFLIDKENSGMLIRASNRSCVVSVATGNAYIGWVSPVSLKQCNKFLTHLNSLSEKNKPIGLLNTNNIINERKKI